MTDKEVILQSIRSNTKNTEPRPDIKSINPTVYDDKVAVFERMVKAVGGDFIDWKNQEDLGTLIKSLYPDAKRFVADFAIEGLVVTDPNNIQSPIDMNGTDVSILKSPLGVCENACCLVTQEDRYRAQFFICEHLVLILDRKDLVNNMHEAYKWIEEHNITSSFYSFISGPSKTADIEQALVMGAHGARTLKVLLR